MLLFRENKANDNKDISKHLRFCSQQLFGPLPNITISLKSTRKILINVATRARTFSLHHCVITVPTPYSLSYRHCWETISEILAMFTLYWIGFCSVSKVAPVQCEQELMFCCGAEIVPKRSQCEQKPHPLCNLQPSLLIWKDILPKGGSVAISAPTKVFRLDSDRFKNLSDTECSTFNNGAKQYCSGAETASKAAFLVWTEALSGTLSATLRFTIRYSMNIAFVNCHTEQKKCCGNSIEISLSDFNENDYDVVLFWIPTRH